MRTRRKRSLSACLVVRLTTSPIRSPAGVPSMLSKFSSIRLSPFSLIAWRFLRGYRSLMMWFGDTIEAVNASGQPKGRGYNDVISCAFDERIAHEQTRRDLALADCRPAAPYIPQPFFSTFHLLAISDRRQWTSISSIQVHWNGFCQGPV